MTRQVPPPPAGAGLGPGPGPRLVRYNALDYARGRARDRALDTLRRSHDAASSRFELDRVRGRAVTLRQLKWGAIAASLVFILIAEVCRRAFYPYLLSWRGRLLMDAVILTGALFVFGILFHLIERMQERLLHQNRELLALQAAALDVWEDLSLDGVLQRVVDQARQLADARYGALSVIDEKNKIQSFVTSGLSPEARAKIGPPPEGHGLLGVVLQEGQRLRLPDLNRDDRSVGFPPEHPPMRSLLAVPVLCKSPFRGNLYLTEKAGSAEEFSPADEETLERFAITAALAIDNAYLHRQLNSLAVADERLRIAHEMHDGLAQVLAYVNTKAQAVREYLVAGRTAEATRQLDQLAAAAREVYADLRESIMGLRSGSRGDRSMREALHEYVTSWQDQSGIACRLEADETLRLEPVVELQLLRIVQEALANVRKHSRAHSASVLLARNAGGVVVTVRDDGVGFDPEALQRSEFPRFGLSTMRERAESIGATVRLETTPGAGTAVTVEVPLEPALGTVKR